MKTPLRKDILHNVALIFLLLFILASSLMWATVSQWREDQSTNLWLGYTRNLLQVPVGLISSANIPNPNGMILLAFFLSRLPSLLVISAFLGCLQGLLIFLICKYNFKNSNSFFWLAGVPPLASVILRASSVEFWNQWIITLVNLAFIFWSLQYLKRPTIWKIPILFFLICLAPALYLAGIVNAIAMSVIGLVLVYFNPPPNWKIGWWKPVAISIIIAVFFVAITWFPFFHIVSIRQLLHVNASGEKLSAVNKARLAFESILGFPSSVLFQWSSASFFPIYQYDSRILSRPTLELIRFGRWVYFFQSCLALSSLAIAIYVNWWEAGNLRKMLQEANKSVLHLVALSVAFIALAYGLSPILSGPVWFQDQRPDQLIQFLPLFLFFCFMTPFAFPLPPKIRRIILRLTYLLATLYAISNVAASLLIVNSSWGYRGPILTEADVPLVQKMDAVDFMARDWKSISNDQHIPVDYQLGGGVWDWVPEVGKKLEVFYPAPMTTGRGFDYDFLRRYGLINAQEGVQLRTFGSGRYLVNYTFEPAPLVPGASTYSFIFGRIRVTIANH